MIWTGKLSILVVTFCLCTTVTQGDVSTTTILTPIPDHHGDGGDIQSTVKVIDPQGQGHDNGGQHSLVDPTPDPLIGVHYADHSNTTGHVNNTNDDNKHEHIATGHDNNATNTKDHGDGHSSVPTGHGSQDDHGSPVGHGNVSDHGDAHGMDHGGNHSGNHSGNHTDHELRFHVAKFDFEHVQVPFIIAAWVVFAMVAKICE